MSGAIKIEPAALRDLLSHNSLFDKLSDEQLLSLAETVSEVREVSADEFLLREGDEARELFIVEDGALEVLKHEPGERADQFHRLAVLTRGMSIGEVSLLDSGLRSASVRAITAAKVLVLPVDRIEQLSRGDMSVDVQMKINMAYEMGRRLRATNETTVRTLREKLTEAETRAEMGKFMARVLIGTCLYMFALSATKSLADAARDTSIVTVPIVAVFAISLFLNIKRSVFPPAAYGFTLKNWRPAVREAVLFSLPVAAAIVAIKIILVRAVPELAGQPVFNLYRSNDVGLLALLGSAVAYSLFAPLQEMVARSGIQSSFMMFLTGRRKVGLSIFLSTLMFSSTHLHVSLTLAMLVFPFGLFWGWLFSRNPTLIGVSLSHVTLGLFAIYVVGIPGFR